MNDLQKDQAIFKAMNEIANEVFTNACDFSEILRNKVSENGGIVSLKDILASRSDFFYLISDASNELYKRENPEASCCDRKIREVTVDTFHCTFHEPQVFELLQIWKSMAKFSPEIVFAYEEKIDLPLITTITISLDNPANAKKLTKCCAKDELRPVLNHVLAEVNLDTEVVDFVATDGHIISIVTTDKMAIHRNNPNDKVLRALFTQKDWERICDYAKKNGNDIVLEFYLHSENQANDTAIAILGDLRIKSVLQEEYCMRFPNWHKIMPFYEKYQHLRLTRDGAKTLAQFVKNDKAQTPYAYTISAYAGRDELYVEFEDFDWSKNVVAKFKLEQPATSDICFGAAKHQMKRLQVNGLWFKDSVSFVILDSNEFDVSMLCPCVHEDGTGHGIDSETADKRRGFSLNPEPVHEEVTEVVEIAA